MAESVTFFRHLSYPMRHTPTMMSVVRDGDSACLRERAPGTLHAYTGGMMRSTNPAWTDQLLADKAERFMLLRPTTRATTQPVEDRYTAAAREIAGAMRRGLHGYRGVHQCTCGCQRMSDNTDHFIRPNLITSSMLVDYVAYHRADCSPEDLERLLALVWEVHK